jgi:hypothetical protein
MELVERAMEMALESAVAIREKIEEAANSVE